jgi:hypothetical protein
LRELPEALGRIPLLTSLNISWNFDITALPRSLANHPHLTSLFLDHTQISKFNFSDFSTLKRLSLIDTSIRDYRGLTLLKESLRELRIGSREDIPSDLPLIIEGLHGLTKLVVTNKWRNAFTQRKNNKHPL